MDHVIGYGVRGISKSIAITSEVIAGQRKKSDPNVTATSQSPDGRRIGDGSDEDVDYTSREQELDEIQDEALPPYSEADPAAAPADEDAIAQSFAEAHAAALIIQPVFTPRRLPQAVLLPQRRPRDRSRGFVRAYAPILGEYSGIDQATFIDFITTWDVAARASPVFDVVNLAAFVVGMFNEPICIAVSTALGTAASVGKELQIRYKSGKYLAQMNEKLFVPRGLFAMVMTYKPEMADEPVLTADTSGSDPTQIALRKASGGSNRVKEVFRRLKTSSGAAAEAQLPECAPLIHPRLDQALLQAQASQDQMRIDNNPADNDQAVPGSTALTPASPSGETSSSSAAVTAKKPMKAFAQHSAVVADYLDRRAQADFVAAHPDSKLTAGLPQSTFVNRFCDPDHPVNSGSIFGLVTGGNWDPIASGRVSRAERAARKNGQEPLTEQERHQAYMGRKVRGRVTGTPSKGGLPVIGKIMRKDMLYLCIVNLPEEMQVQDALNRIRGTV